MPIKPCSKLWTELNIKVHRKMITNCCKRKQHHTPTIEEFKTMGADYWAFKPEVVDDKAHFVEINDFPIGCQECALYHPHSRYSTHNEWENKDNNFFARSKQKDFINSIELSLSSTCNMTCMYCIPEVSSLWAKKLGVPEAAVDIEWRDAMLESLYAYIERDVVYRENVEYTFLGGEPFLEPAFLDVIEKLCFLHAKTNKMPCIRFVTNGNVGPSVLDKFFQLTNLYPTVHWDIAMSLDAIGQRGEIIREGLDFARFEENFIRFLQNKNTSIGVLPTVNALSIVGMLDFHKWLADKFIKYRGIEGFGKEWTIHLNVLHQPKEISLGILPKEMNVYVDETINYVNEIIKKLPEQKIKDTSKYIRQLENVKNLMGQHRSDKKFMLRSKQWFISQGKIHNRDYWKQLPELEKVFDGVE